MQLRKSLKVVRILLWKSWKIRLHYKKCFIALFMLPLICPALLTLYYIWSNDAAWTEKYDGNKGPYATATYAEPLELFKISFPLHREPCWGGSCYHKICYTPDTEYTRHVMEIVRRIFEEKVGRNGHKFWVHSKKSEREIRRLLATSSRDNDLYIGCLLFHNVDVGNKKIPLKVHYDLIVAETITQANIYKDTLHYRWWTELNFRKDDYVKEKFLVLQAAVDMAHLRIINEQYSKLDVFMQYFPLPASSKQYSTFEHMNTVIAMSFAMSLCFILPVTVKRIVEEKATRVREYLTCCGVNPGLYWLTTHLDTFSLVAFETLALTLIHLVPLNMRIERIRGNYHHADASFAYFGMEDNSPNAHVSVADTLNSTPSLLFFLFVLYCIQTTVFVSFLTIFFENANIASAVSIVVWIVTALYPTYSCGTQFDSLPYSSIFPNCSLFWLIYTLKGRHFLHHEKNAFSNIFENNRVLDSGTVGDVVLFMVISSITYGFFTWYLTEIWPWQKGVSKPWYFPLRRQYKKYFRRTEEECTPASSAPLIIEKVSKRYKSKRSVLNAVSFDVDDKNLTVLLGPNGSGKSTLINIICGLGVQTQGSVSVNGYNTEDNMEQAMSCLGFCPQHNTYFKYLTVRENLELICFLKTELRVRMDGHKVEEIIQLLNLEQFSHEVTQYLSGGVLRRLTLGMALVGPCDILVIDEPTESLDPIAKRCVWDILVKSRETKTILVCSHQLDEVNVIADRVAVLIYGNLKCYKTTHELKKEYGMGYTLRIKKNQDFTTNENIEATVFELTDHATVESNSSTSEELVVHLPFEESSVVPLILRSLEENSHNLSIESMSLYATTLEDVYSKLIADENFVEETTGEDWNFDASTDFELDDTEGEFRKSIVNVIYGQMQAVIRKNFLYAVHHWTLLLINIAIPLLLMFIVLLAVRITVRKQSPDLLEPFKLKEDMYGSDSYSFVDSHNESFVNAYKSISKSVIREDKTVNLQDWLLSFANDDSVDYFTNFLFGATLNQSLSGKPNLVVFANPSASHAAPISLNKAMTAMLRWLTKSNDYSITIENSWTTQRARFDANFAYQKMSTYDNQLLPLGILVYGICYSAYVIRPVVERSVGFTHLQLMTGAQPIVYWVANLVFDLLFNIACSAVHITFFYIIDSGAIYTASPFYFISMVTVFFLAGFSQIPFMYLTSFAFKKATAAYLFMAVYCTTVGLSLIIVTTNMGHRAELISIHLLVLCPFIAFPQALVELHKAFAHNTFCDRISDSHSFAFCMSEREFMTENICCPNLCSNRSQLWHQMQNCAQTVNPFIYKHEAFNVLTLIVAMLVSGVCCFALTNILEYNSLHGFLWRFRTTLKAFIGLGKPPRNYDTTNSEDVTVEANYVADIISHNRISQESLVMHELTKQFESLRIPNRLNMTVRKGECFGLVGSNACGKTTTFKLLTSQMKPTFGNVYIGDLNTSLMKNVQKYLSLIGYCPQTDALLDCLTGHQTVKLFMKLRGISDLHEMQTIVKKFHLQSVMNDKVSTYSGGNRRKLALALALIGKPKVLLLDEPTNGVDPCSRRKVWQLLRNISETSQVSILLTSHNMQEVETLCDRIAVMIIGKVIRIDSLAELREKFGKGFNLIVKLEKEVAESEEDLRDAKQRIKDVFVDTRLSLSYENFGVLYYNLGSKSNSLLKIFEKMEELKKRIKIEDYIISNANFEHTLTNFIKHVTR